MVRLSYQSLIKYGLFNKIAVIKGNREERN